MDQLIPQSKTLQSEESDIDSGKHSLDNSPPLGKKFWNILKTFKIIFIFFFQIILNPFSSVVIHLTWDSDQINEAMSYPPIYKVYQEYKKQKNERNLNMMKYQYEFMQTIVEAIKTVSSEKFF